MANDISANFEEFWSRRLQRVSEKIATFRKITSLEEASTLKKGDTVHRPYMGALVANTLGATGAYTRQDIGTTDESMTVGEPVETTYYVQDPDVIQSKYSVFKNFNDRAAYALSNKLDGDVLGEYDQADSVVANYELGGGGTASDGVGFTLTVSNLLKVFTRANKKLDLQNLGLGERKAVISPAFKQVLIEYLAGKESALGDSTGRNGHIGKFGGFELYLSNALGWSGRLENGTIFADGDTITINGVELNFKDILGAVAGTIHICTDQEKTLNSLVAAINTPGTSVDSANDAGFVAVSAANQALLATITATDGGTYMTLKAEGRGYIAVSESVTAVADIWTTTKQIEHNLFLQGTPIDLAIQKMPSVSIWHRDGYVGSDVTTWQMYALKTFAEGARQMVDVAVRSDAF